MAFSQESNKVPTTIGNITVVLAYPVDATLTPVPDAEKTGTFRIDVFDQNDELLKQLRGDLKPHLNATQLQRISDFLDDLRAQAALEIL